MSEDWETDDWHAPIISSDYTLTSQVKLTYEDEDHSSVQARPVIEITAYKQNTKTDIGRLAENAVPIFKNNKIQTGVMIRIDPEYGRMRIFNTSGRSGPNLNALYEINDLTAYLKSAIHYYSNAKKATTTNANRKQLKLLTEALDKVNGAIHTHELAFRRLQSDSMREMLETSRVQKSRLEAEISMCLTIDINEQKNDYTKLKQTAQSVLRILAGKDNSRARALHHQLKIAVNPERYKRELDAIEEARRTAQLAEEEKRERDRELRRINGFVSRFSKVDKENFMRLRELLRSDPNADIPFRLEKYYDAVCANPYLSFEEELRETPRVQRQMKMSAEHEYRVNFPEVRKVQPHNAWSVPLGTKPEVKQTLIGAWTKQLDREALANLPDPEPVKRPAKISENLSENNCESEEEFFDDYNLESESDDDWN